ncbi:MAG: phosphoribosyltransferase family protein [Gemmataceae bacterium]
MTPEQREALAQETLHILTASGAILDNDHFVYISGDHGSGWIDMNAIYPHTERLEQLCRALARLLRDHDIQVVVGPATGGLIVAEWTAHELGVLAAFTEHAETVAPGEIRGRFILRRGYDHLVTGQRVLVVDDIVNTGWSTRQTVAAVRQAGGHVVAAACLVTRGNVDATGVTVPDFEYLLEHRIPSWPAAQCHLCQAGVPINTRYAHGRDFLAKQGRLP